jgi:hypothetical protein
MAESNGTSAAAASTSAVGNTGVNAADAAQSPNATDGQIVYGKPQTQGDDGQARQDTSTDRQAQYQEFKTRFKDEFDSEVQGIIKGRLRKADATQRQLDGLAPLMQMLGTKYGVDPSDAAAIVKAVQDDDSYYEDEALEKGLTVAQLKQIKKLEAENEEFRAAARERETDAQAQQIYAKWVEQTEQAKQIYPGIDLRTEAQDPGFMKLLRAGVDVATAYSVIHRNEIMPAVMQYGAKQGEAAAAAKIKKSTQMPSENGLKQAPGATYKSDPSTLTHEDFERIRERVARGEKISF